MPKYVVAVDIPVMGPKGSTVVEYLGIPPARFSSSALDTERTVDPPEFWFVEPGDAADRPGECDYTRFTDDAEAVAWCLRVQDHYDTKMPDRHGYKVYIRQID